MTTQRRTAWLLAMAIAGGGVLACGGSPKAPAAGREPAPAAGAPASARNACEFVDRAAIETMAGKKLDMLHNIEAEDQTACELTDPENHIMVFQVTVHWKGGKDMARVEQSAMSMAKQLMNDDGDTDILELTGSEKVRGLADKAFYSDIMPSWVLKGDVMIQTIAPLFSHENTKRAFLLTAKKALSQLPAN